jgi:SAM-dependent methyltransferase
MSDGGEGWQAYVADFHARRPGITELVLAHTDAGGINPYEWMSEPIPRRGAVLDLACGSAPLFDLWPSQWAGVDRSTAELRLAIERGATTAAVGDATAVPWRAQSFDAVACAMGLMLFQPIENALAEVVRLLRPGGVLTALVPAKRPLRTIDRARYARLLVALRRRRFEYPNNVARSRWTSLLRSAGLEPVDDESRRFSCHIATPEIARLCVTSLYLPGLDDEHLGRGIRVAERWVGKVLGLPLRRLVARRPHAEDAGAVQGGPG